MEEIKIIYPTYENIILINYFNNSVIMKNINKGKFKIDEDSIIITWNENLESEDYFIKNKTNLIPNNNEDILNNSLYEEYIYKETKSIYKNNIVVKLHSLNNTLEIILYKNMFKFYDSGIVSDIFLGTYVLNRKTITIKWNQDKSVEEFKKKNNFLNFNEEETYIKNENNEFYIVENKINDNVNTNTNTYKNNNIEKNLELYLVHKDWEGICYLNNSFITKKNEYDEDDIAPYVLSDNILTVNWENYNPEDFLLNHFENKYYLKNISEEEIYLIYSEKNNNKNILINNNFILNKIDKNIYQYDEKIKKKIYKGAFNIIDNILVINWNNDNIDNFNLNEKTEYGAHYSEYILNNLFQKLYIKNNDSVIDKYKIYLLNKNDSKLFFYNKNNLFLFDYLKIDEEFIMIYFLKEVTVDNNMLVFDENFKFTEKINELLISKYKNPEYLYEIYKFNFDEIKYYTNVTENYLEEINIEHKDWKEICIINKYLKILYRKSELSEYGNYILNENKLIIYWNKWNEEVFINNNGIYYYDNYSTNNMNSISSSFINNNITNTNITNTNNDNNKIKEIKLETNKDNKIQTELTNGIYDKKIKSIPNIVLNKVLSELDNEKIFIYHLDWNDECFIKDNYMYRKSNEYEYGKFFYKKNKLIIYWEKWDKDLFFYIENKFYSQKFLKYLNFNNKNYIINIFLNKIYQEINEKYIYIGSFNYIFDKISILWESETENKDYSYESDIFYLDIEESEKKTDSYKFDIIILNDENIINENNDDNSINSDISYYEINFNEIIEYNEDLNEIYIKDYNNNNYKNYIKNDPSYNNNNKNYKKNDDYNNEYNHSYNEHNNEHNYINEYSKNYKIINKLSNSEFYKYLILDESINDLIKIIEELEIFLIPIDIIRILVFYSIIFLIKK